jgi:hypothetical protein
MTALTGTQRAAVRLALACLRHYPRPDEAGDAIEDACDALCLPMWAPPDGLRDTSRAALDARMRCEIERPLRLVRARLALYLRALLRVDAGDCGPLWHCRCTARGATGQPKGIRATRRCSWCEATSPDGAARITPLWERAGGGRG